MKRRRKLLTGGQIGTGVGAIAGSVIPGVGTMLGAQLGGMLGSGFDNMQPETPTVPLATRTTGSYGYATGGRLPVTAPVEQPLGRGAARFEGPRHEQGGIPVNEQGNISNQPVAEVEGGETRQGNYIFSDRLKVPGTDLTFAQMHQRLLEEGAPEEQIEELRVLQEQQKRLQGVEDSPQLVNGGYIDEIVVTGKGNKQGSKRTPTPGLGYTIPEANVAGMTAASGPDVNPVVYEPSSPTSFENVMNVAQYAVPSLMRLGMAAFTDRPQDTPLITYRGMPTTNPAFKEARRDMSRAYRASTARADNPNQQLALHSQYLEGRSGLASDEAEYAGNIERQNIQNRMNVQAQNAQITARNNQAREQDQAARMGMVADAIQMPITGYMANKQGLRSQIANIITSANQIPDPADRRNTIRMQLRAIGVDQQEINKILSQYGT